MVTFKATRKKKREKDVVPSRFAELIAAEQTKQVEARQAKERAVVHVEEEKKVDFYEVFTLIWANVGNSEPVLDFTPRKLTWIVVVSDAIAPLAPKAQVMLTSKEFHSSHDLSVTVQRNPDKTHDLEKLANVAVNYTLILTLPTSWNEPRDNAVYERLRHLSKLTPSTWFKDNQESMPVLIELLAQVAHILRKHVLTGKAELIQQQAKLIKTAEASIRVLTERKTELLAEIENRKGV